MTDHTQLERLFYHWGTPPEELVGTLPRGGTQLSYLGHAAVTRALLECDPAWVWEPVAWNDNGTPYITHQGSRLVMWIRLTVAGVTRLGVGTCPDNKGDPEKELIGDALRNAAMRFGVALSLWAKEEWTPPGSGESRVSVDTDTYYSLDPANSQEGSGDNGPLLGADIGTPDPVDDGRYRRASFSDAMTAAAMRSEIRDLINTLEVDQWDRLRTWLKGKQWAVGNVGTTELGDIHAYIVAMKPPELGDY